MVGLRAQHKSWTGLEQDLVLFLLLCGVAMAGHETRHRVGVAAGLRARQLSTWQDDERQRCLLVRQWQDLAELGAINKVLRLI